MRISMGQVSAASQVTPGPMVECLANTPEGMYYYPGPNDPPGYYDANAPLCYSNTPATSTAPVSAPAEVPPTLPTLPAITPLNITQPLPSVTATLAPSAISTCDAWDEINGWIAANPFWAAGILAAFAFLGLRGKK